MSDTKYNRYSPIAVRMFNQYSCGKFEVLPQECEDGLYTVQMTVLPRSGYCLTSTARHPDGRHCTCYDFMRRGDCVHCQLLDIIIDIDTEMTQKRHTNDTKTP